MEKPDVVDKLAGKLLESPTDATILPRLSRAVGHILVSDNVDEIARTIRILGGLQMTNQLSTEGAAVIKNLSETLMTYHTGKQVNEAQYLELHMDLAETDDHGTGLVVNLEPGQIVLQ